MSTMCENQQLNEGDIKLEDMQRIQLELLHELDRICRKNHLHYVLSSGTCLGALRHGGFIPWDDDIDVYMSWKEAEMLIECQDQFQDRYFVQSYKTDPEFPPTHYRLCDSSTSCFMKDTQGLNINHGIFIDIYIYYPYLLKDLNMIGVGGAKTFLNLYKQVTGKVENIYVKKADTTLR